MRLKLSILLFADDVAIFGDSVVNLQKKIDILNNIARNKTKVKVFKK